MIHAIQMFILIDLCFVIKNYKFVRFRFVKPLLTFIILIIVYEVSIFYKQMSHY